METIIMITWIVGIISATETQSRIIQTLQIMETTWHLIVHRISTGYHLKITQIIDKVDKVKFI
jgi:hypothetical protein